ncbi:roadblock/LC7 domain-containing protein [Acinetobacter faecalis]|uniref:roadblock/LC7 domain-containing protein n=1 Tax=Acinetobacter faecalis TaxID=2665161 RepID=UPI002A91D420|nr:roadblock/LC7 domain-containing protein [Acinetobacter faecalis]MDY6451532.1 roadblock/LC7 domain-containing protein [Acinetobacter faecalis]MDY6469168.1 roadblock/LC7 domain-containing protein [Acinetobacter faecalis]MDY6482796.1 roadblock/LC7 domain-containing protein [Acinetobacter faecalis]
MFAVKNERKTPDHVIQHAKNEIQHIINTVSGVNFIMLCSTDGFELATLYKLNTFNNTKIAAVSSSLHAMVSALMNELQLTGCQSITLDADNGKALLTSVNGQYPMIIVTLANKDILLGQLLHELKNASISITNARD